MESWEITFKCPGSGSFMIPVTVVSGQCPRRIAIHAAITAGYSRQCGQWSTRAVRAW